jgi:hypothetical protein
VERLGAALYRAGRYDEAATLLTRAVRQDAKGGTVWMQLVLALACHRRQPVLNAVSGFGLAAGPSPVAWTVPGVLLPRSSETQARLDKAVKQIEATPDAGWKNNVRWRSLHQEAEALLRPAPR